jgi:hypothetical protein
MALPRSGRLGLQGNPNTYLRCYQYLMYIGLRTSDTLHKKFCRTGLGLCGASENCVHAKFAEIPFYELR